MEAATVHQLRPGDFPWPDDSGELISIETAIDRIRGLMYENEGLVKLTKKQAKENAQLSRRIQEDADPMRHPKGADIVKLIERWKRATGHEKSKTSADRVKLIKARLSDEYSVEQIALAIDGLACFPFVVNAQRKSEGKPSQRFDQLEHALKGGQKLERFAVLGHQARQAGLVTWEEADE